MKMLHPAMTQAWFMTRYRSRTRLQQNDSPSPLLHIRQPKSKIWLDENKMIPLTLCPCLLPPTPPPSPPPPGREHRRVRVTVAAEASAAGILRIPAHGCKPCSDRGEASAPPRHPFVLPGAFVCFARCGRSARTRRARFLLHVPGNGEIRRSTARGAGVGCAAGCRVVCGPARGGLRAAIAGADPERACLARKRVCARTREKRHTWATYAPQRHVLSRFVTFCHVSAAVPSRGHLRGAPAPRGACPGGPSAGVTAGFSSHGTHRCVGVGVGVGVRAPVHGVRGLQGPHGPAWFRFRLRFLNRLRFFSFSYSCLFSCLYSYSYSYSYSFSFFFFAASTRTHARTQNGSPQHTVRVAPVREPRRTGRVCAPLPHASCVCAWARAHVTWSPALVMCCTARVTCQARRPRRARARRCEHATRAAAAGTHHRTAPGQRRLETCTCAVAA